MNSHARTVRRAPRALPHAQRGFSFFEILVAAIILGIGVLGFAGLQVRALDTTGIAHYRAQASVLAGELSERIRMADNGLTLNHTAYEDPTLWDAANPPPDTPPATWQQGKETCIYGAVSGAACGEAEVVLADSMEIRYLAQELLPAGNVTVQACEAGSTLTCVFVGWRGQDAHACALGDGNENCLGMQVYF